MYVVYLGRLRVVVFFGNSVNIAGPYAGGGGSKEPPFSRKLRDCFDRKVHLFCVCKLISMLFYLKTLIMHYK